MMHKKYRFLGFFMAVLVLGAANHCAFEELLVNLRQAIFGLEVPQHLPNHPGATEEHQHENSSESHQHGQAHSILALTSGKVIVDVDLFFTTCFLLVMTSVFLFQRSNSKELNPTCLSADDSTCYFRRAFISLSSASQAPPTFLSQV